MLYRFSGSYESGSSQNTTTNNPIQTDTVIKTISIPPLPPIDDEEPIDDPLNYFKYLLSGNVKPFDSLIYVTSMLKSGLFNITAPMSNFVRDFLNNFKVSKVT